MADSLDILLFRFYFFLLLYLASEEMNWQLKHFAMLQRVNIVKKKKIRMQLINLLLIDHVALL